MQFYAELALIVDCSNATIGAYGDTAKQAIKAIKQRYATDYTDCKIVSRPALYEIINTGKHTSEMRRIIR